MSYSADLDVRVTDSSLRDGSHAIRHQFTIENTRNIVAALDDACVPVIEVTHGDGLGGSSFNYGFSAVPDQDLIATAVATAKQAKIAFLMLPGLGTADDIRQAAGNGASVCRIATHCTEADISIQHFKVARSIGLETVGFLMMAHSQPPEVLARQARIMADAGAQCVYVVDSAGALIMDGVSDRIAALVAELGDDAQVGFHGHLGAGRPGGGQADRRVHPPLRRRRGQHPGRGVRRRQRAARHQDRHRHGEDHRRRRGDRRPGPGKQPALA
jgi:4-hydroxy 2-oxovalerate aldolase